MMMGDPTTLPPDTRDGLLEWIKTFGDVSSAVSSLESLCDGVVLYDILCQIAPDHFHEDNVARTATTNWAVAQSNLKKVLKNLELYYAEDLHLKADFESVDVSSISRDRNLVELVKVIELMVGAAVRCDNRAHYIEAIMGLSHDSQAILKGMVESAMRRTTELEQQHHSTESMMMLSQQEQELKATLRTADEENTKLRQEIDKLKEKLGKSSDELEDMRHTSEGLFRDLEAQRRRAEAAENHGEELRNTLDGMKLKLEEKDMDLDHLRQEAEVMKEKWSNDKEKIDRLEDAKRRLADELDVARAKAGELSKAESTVEKYKKKLDEMATAKQHIQQIEEQNSKYLEQIMSLEDQVKSIPGLRRTIEQYKDKVVEVEREKFKAQEMAQVKEGEISKLRAEVEAAQDAKRFLEDELSALRETSMDGEENTQDMGLGLFEGMTDAKERCMRLERENKALREQLTGAGVSGLNGEDSDLLTSRIEDLERVKAEREQEALEARRQCKEYERELTKLREHALDLETSLADLSKGATDAAAAQDVLIKLTKKVEEKEKKIAGLTLEKDKLENYVKGTLTVVKESWAHRIQELTERNRVLEEKMQKDKATQRREERLLASAIFEVGMDMIERGITEKAGGSSAPVRR